MIHIVDYPLKTEETPIKDSEQNCVIIYSRPESRASRTRNNNYLPQVTTSHIKTQKTFQRANSTSKTAHLAIKAIVQEQLKRVRKKKSTKSLFNKEEDKGELTCNERFKKSFLNFMDKPAVIIYMSGLTFFALYLSDVQSAWCPPYVDFPFDIIQLFVFISFTAEITLCSYCDCSYFLSLFFWLDLVSTLSLLIDVGFIFDKIIESLFEGKSIDQARLTLSKISTASGTTRVLRILRIIKLIQLVKLYKTINQAKMNIAKKQEAEKRRIKQLLNGTANESSTMDHPGRTGSSLNLNRWRINEFKDIDLARINALNEKNCIEDNVGPPVNEGTSRGLMEYGGGIEVNQLEINDGCHIKTSTSSHLITAEENRVDDNDKANDNINDSENGNDEGDNPNHFAKVKKIEDISDDLMKESNISKVISASLTNKIFFLVMIVLIVYPFLSEDFYVDETEKISYQILGKYLDNYLSISSDTLKLKTSEFIAKSMDSFLPLLNITYNDSLVYSNANVSAEGYRSSEVKSIYSPSGSFVLTFSIKNETQLTAMLNFFRTLFVCILVGVSICLIEGQTREYVLEPLEVMMEMVDMISRDPVNAKNIDKIQSGTKATIDKMKNRTKQEEQKQYEIVIIKQAIIKISSLLSMGFGQIGGRVIKNNLYEIDGVKLKSKGKYVAGLYCSISIRNYNEVVNRLRSHVVIFDNELSEVIHTSVDRYSGCITRNLDYWTAVWKYSSRSPLMNSDKSKKASEKVTTEQYNALVTSLSDLALLSLCHVYLKAVKLMPRISYLTDCGQLENAPNDFQLKLDLNLHCGLSVEGVIGSHLKLDAAHIGKDVFISQQMRHLNRLYGVSIIFTDEVYRTISDNLKSLSRPIDVVHFAFNPSRKYKLYTIDINPSLPLREKSQVMYTKQEKELLSQEKKKEFYTCIKAAGSVSSFILTKGSFIDLFSVEKDDSFYLLWSQGFGLYEAGQFTDSLKLFKQCAAKCPKDGPCLFLMKQIEQYPSTPPAEWMQGRLADVY